MKPTTPLAYLLIAFLGMVVTISVLQVGRANRPQGARLAPSLPSSTAVKASSTRAATYKPAPTRTLTPTRIPPTSTVAVTPVPPTETQNPDIPDKYYITNITGHAQYLSIGCEASAAVDWAHYFGVSINEKEFQSQLPITDNPDTGFVGDVNGSWGHIPPDDYGVHAEPVAALLRDYGLDAVGEKGLTLDDIKASIAQGKPVIAWVVGNVTYGTPLEYTDSEGNVTTVAAYEHVVIVIGYGSQTIRYMNNGEQFEVTNKLFSASWGTLGNMAVLMMGE